MTYRVYLAAATFSDGAPNTTDLPAERVFINASDVPEIWVETESVGVPDVGRAVSFALRSKVVPGFSRIQGTIERRVLKQDPSR